MRIIASRGSQEIGSCLLSPLENKLHTNTKHVILYSDSCVGQNKSIKLALLLKRFLHGSTAYKIETITQKYFVSGHSFNSCDRRFGLVEKQRKFSKDIYVPKHWQNIIKQAKKSDPAFELIEMEEEDFFTSSELEKLIVNRKKDASKDKINWFSFRSILYRIEDPFILTFKTDDSEEEYSINLAREGVNEQTFKKCSLHCLYPGGKEITTEKLRDLMQLLKYVPAEFHSFYSTIRSTPRLDYGLVSDGSESSGDESS